MTDAKDDSISQRVRKLLDRLTKSGPVGLDVCQFFDAFKLLVVHLGARRADPAAVAIGHPLATDVVAQQVPSDPIEPRSCGRACVLEAPALHEGGGEGLGTQVSGGVSGVECAGRETRAPPTA